MSRQGIPDYLVTMRKPGENPERVTKDPDEFPVSLWQNYASPVWMDINPSETLQRESAREERDERHIAPLAVGSHPAWNQTLDEPRRSGTRSVYGDRINGSGCHRGRTPCARH